MVEDRETTKKALRSFFALRQEIILSYLFGSYLQGAPGKFRDIDIAVYVDPPSLSSLDRTLPYGYAALLNTDLSELLSYSSIDLTVLNQAPPLLLKEVIRNGELIFSRSEDERIRFEIHALKRYADTKSIRDIKNQYMRERIRKGATAYEPARDH